MSSGVVVGRGVFGVWVGVRLLSGGGGVGEVGPGEVLLTGGRLELGIGDDLVQPGESGESFESGELVVVGSGFGLVVLYKD